MKRTRVIHSDNGTLTDITNDMNRYRSGTHSFDYVSGEDKIFIGNVAPFNFLYFKLSTPSSATINMSLKYWTGSTFHPVVEVRDQTDGFKQSGYVEFVPDKDQGWNRDDTDEGGGITGLSSLTIYDKYWIEITFDGNTSSGVVLDWIGQLFSDDDDLRAEHPDLVRSNVFTAFESGKTDWQEQHVKAAEIVVRDLINSKVIWTKNQILDRDQFLLPAVSKCAEMIYSAFGDDFVDQMRQSRKEYKARFDKSIYAVDLNNNGILDVGEMGVRQGHLKR